MVDDSFWGRLERRVTEILEWADRTVEDLDKSTSFGDFFERLDGRIKSLYKYAFSGRNIIVYGPRGSGKTSLIGYLRTGRASVQEHDPTAGVALVDRSFEIERSEWLRVQKDPGGDHLYRHLWPALTRAVDPEAVIYMIDGRKSASEIERDMEECLHDSLSEYTTGGRLGLIYVFVNFYDAWRADPDKAELLCPELQLIAARRKLTYPPLKGITLKALPTHVNPRARAWPELDNALEHFATDLNKLAKPALS